MHSASPAARWRRASDCRHETSATTAAGWWNAPSRFFARGWLTATLPPSAPSTWASSVVGRFTYGMPRMYALATHPPRSFTTPPPSVRMTSRRASRPAASQSHSAVACSRLLLVSPAGTACRSTSQPSSRSPATSGGANSDSTTPSVITPTFLPRTSGSSRSSVSSSDRVMWIGYRSTLRARPSIAAAGAGSGSRSRRRYGAGGAEIGMPGRLRATASRRHPADGGLRGGASSGAGGLRLPEPAARLRDAALDGAARRLRVALRDGGADLVELPHDPVPLSRQQLVVRQGEARVDRLEQAGEHAVAGEPRDRPMKLDLGREERVVVGGRPAPQPGGVAQSRMGRVEQFAHLGVRPPGGERGGRRAEQCTAL